MEHPIHNPVLIVIAGPNGSGKTSVTSKTLHHDKRTNYQKKVCIMSKCPLGKSNP